MFPQALAKEQARIVGINYQLTEEPPPPPKDLVSQLDVKPRKKEKVQAKPPKVERKPELKTFDVVVRRTATLEETEHVKALNEEAAREAALVMMKGKPFEVSPATVRVEITSVAERSNI